MHHFQPPHISADWLDTSSHTVNALTTQNQVVSSPPSEAGVLEVWAAVVPASGTVDKAYIAFTWMRPAATLPMRVNVADVLGEQRHSGACHIMYRARWAKDGEALSGWSNTLVMDDRPS